MAFHRWSDDEGARLYIYNIANNRIDSKLDFSEYSLYGPIQWHKDSDSVIFNQSITEIIDEGTSYDHEYYYRVYFSGERVLLFDTYHNPNAMLINFDFNSVFKLEDDSDSLHNWVDNTKYTFDYYSLDYELFSEGCLEGWSHDGLQFLRVNCEYGKITFIDTKNGRIIKTIDIPYSKYVHVSPWSRTRNAREEYINRYSYLSLSPDSKHLLLTDDSAGLYDLNLETSAVEPIYIWPADNPENQINGLWSNSGNLIMVNTYYADSSVPFQYVDDQRVLVVKKGNLPVRVATNAEPLFWLSKDSERLVYAQYKISGDKINGDLMVYDHATGASIKVGDLPTIKDVDTSSGISYGYYMDSVDWTNGEVDLPEAPPLPGITPPTPSICPDATSVQPIMLVVGWGGSEGSPGLAKETNEFAVYTREFFAKYGYVPECNIFYATGTSPNKKQKENAREIQRSMCDAYEIIKSYRPDWNGHFDIIGHSYGGLRSRTYLEDVSLYGYCTVNGATEKAIKVDNLFTLGSPHGGEPYDFDMLPLAMLILWGDISGRHDRDQFPVSWAAAELLPPIRTVVNKTSRQPKGVNYHLIIGNVTKDSVEYAKTIGFWMYFGEPDANYSPGEVYDHDLAVHQESSLILSTPELKSRYPLMRTVVTQDWHGWDPSGRALIPIFSPPTYYADSETLAREVLPYIGKTETPSGGGGGGSWMVLPINLQNKIMVNIPPISLTQQELHEYAPQVNVHIGDGILTPGQSQQFELNVSQSENMDITLITGNDDLQLQLIQPDGQSVTKERAGIQYQELTLEGRTLKGYQFANMMAGKWIVVVDGTTISDEASFITSATPSMPIALQPILPEWRPNQNVVEISVKVLNGDTLIPNGSLTALIIRPDGSQQALDLLDDGLHQDGVTNDGWYGNGFSQTDIGGVYRVFFTATGTFNGQAFVRNAFSYFVIAPATAKLGDQFSDSGIDENKDGAYEFLEIQAPLLVNQPGDFVISGDLYAGDTFIAPAVTHQSFQAGSQTIVLRFDGELIYNSQKDGSYTVHNILLLDETEIPLLIEEKQAYTTAQYSYKDFGSKDAIFPSVTSSSTLFIAGGLGLLCLAVLAIGGVFVYTRTRKPKRAPAKPVGRPQASKPVSASAEQVKRAIELSKAKRYQEAFEILRGIVQAEPNNMSAWFNLGGVLASMGNYKDAERCYERAKQLGHPRGDDALNWLRQHRK